MHALCSYKLIRVSVMPNTLFSRFVSARPTLFIAALLMWLPMVGLFVPSIIQAFYAEWIAGALGVALAISVVKKEVWVDMRVPQTSLIFIGLLLIVLVQWMLGMLHSKQYAISVIFYLLWACSLTMIGGKLKRDYGWQMVTQYFAWALSLGGLLVTLLYVLQTYQLLPESAIQPAHIVAYLGLSLVSVIYLLAKQQMPIWLGATLILMLSTAINAVPTGLGWWLLVAIVMIMIAQQIMAIKQQSGNRQRRTMARLGLMLLPLFVLMHFITPEISRASTPSNMLSFALPITQTLQAYLDVWKTSWQIFMGSPWLGVGVGNLPWHAYLSVQAPVMQGEIGVFSHTHNQWLQVLVTLGAGGLLLVLVGLVGWLAAFGWRHATVESWWLVAVIAVLLTHGLLEPQLGYAYFLGIFAILLGMGDEKTTLFKLPALGAFISATYATALFIMLATTLIAYQKLNDTLPLAQKRKLTSQQETELHQNLGWVYNNTALSPYAQLVYAKGVRVDTAAIDAKLWLSDAAMRFRPSKKLAYQHVMLLKLSGDHAQAVTFLKRTLNAYPMRITQQLELFPIKYYQDYLDVLSEARPIKLKTKPATKKQMLPTL